MDFLHSQLPGCQTVELHIRRDLRNAGQVDDALRQGYHKGQAGVLLDFAQVDGADAQHIAHIVQGRLTAGYPDGFGAEGDGGVVLVGAAALNQIVGQAQILHSADGNLQPHLFHIGGNELGIHRVPVFVTERIVVGFADGFPSALQVHGNGGLGDGIHHGFGSRDGDRREVQHLILPVDHKALGGRSVPDHFHGNGFADPADNGDIDAVRVLGLDDKGVACHIAGEGGGGVVDADLAAGLPDGGQIRLNGDVSGIDPAQVRPVAGELQVHRIGGHGGDHQAVLVEEGFPLPHNGDIIIGIRGAWAHRGNHIQPQAKGTRQGEQRRVDLILHGPCPPFPGCAAASGNRRRMHPPPLCFRGTGHCAAAFPGYGGPDAA